MTHLAAFQAAYPAFRAAYPAYQEACRGNWGNQGTRERALAAFGVVAMIVPDLMSHWMGWAVVHHLNLVD